jgi:hypothetical protein
MVVAALFVISAVVVVLTLLGRIPVLFALPAIGLVIAVMIGFSMRRTGAQHPRA